MAELGKISSVWKTGRLLLGFTQKDLAKKLDISQSNISKIESMQLEPSASDWYLFCQLVGIDAHKSLQLGYIDGRNKFKKSLYQDSLFYLPIKYRRDFSLKMRDLIPYKVAVTTQLGPHAWDEFLTECELVPEMFNVYDFQISFQVFVDLSAFCSKKGISFSDFKGTPQLSWHGLFDEDYQKKKNAIDLLKILIENQSFYQKVLTPELEQSDSNLKCSLFFAPEMTENFTAEVLDQYLDYKLNILKQSISSSFKGQRVSVKNIVGGAEILVSA